MGEHCSKSGSSGAFAFSAVHVTHDVELLKGEDAQRSCYVSDSSTSVDAFGAPLGKLFHITATDLFATVTECSNFTRSVPSWAG